MFPPSPSGRIPPCQCGCPNGNDVRGWLAVIAQRHKNGLDEATALRVAWEQLAEGNPFPAIMGRICPHPCEAACSRGDKDGPVAIHALERYLGDWAVTAGLRLRREAGVAERESVGVIGGGPAGLSFAYQMARRGYRVTIYERSSRLGGMLTHGIPEYRLPRRVIEAEIGRILELGVEVRLSAAVGREVSWRRLRERHAAIFVAIGAGIGRSLGIPGEDGPGVMTGTEFLGGVNRGEVIDLGRKVVVVGGGNTAVDAARTALRTGAEVTVLYRRTREEMPAIGEEIDEALAEGVRLMLLAAPERIVRENGTMVAVEVQRMRLGDPDASGRRRPLPLPGETFRIPADTVLAAVSQQPDWTGLEDLAGEGVQIGGDAREPGIAGMAIAQGRQAAEAVHRRLRGLSERGAPDPRTPISAQEVKPQFYADRAPVTPPTAPVTDRVANPRRETVGTIDEDRFFAEVERCFSCGLCFGCQHCWTYCGASGFTKIAEPRPGAYFALALERCERCGKCVDLCPSGYLSPGADPC